MTTSQQAEIQTLTLDVPGATLTYDIRGELGDATPDRPVLVLLGSPMTAAAFGALAGHFTDRPVVTYDPRGAGRSILTDGATETTVDQHADDIRRVVEALGVGPVDLFATSGGAVNSLAMVSHYPEPVRTLVAHEPPLAAYLPDREVVLAANRDIGETYQRSGMGPAMAKFIQLVMVEGPLTAAYLEQPDPDPAQFGLPSEDDGSRNDPLLALNNPTCVSCELDIEALTSSPTRIVVAVGVESAQELAGRGAAGVADALGIAPTTFPSHHAGFMRGEYGPQGEPDAFAARLHEVLASSA